MSQGGQTNRRAPQYNDPYHALNSIGNLSAPTSGKAFGSGNSMSDPFANQPRPNQSPIIYTTQDNGYQNPILGGVNQTQPNGNVYAGTNSIGTMANQPNPYANTQASSMQYASSQNNLFPMNQVDGEKNGVRLNPDLNSFDMSGQPVDQNYGNYNQASQPQNPYYNPNAQGYYQPANSYQQPQPNLAGNQANIQPYQQTPNGYHIAQDYDQMYTHAPLLPQIDDARPSGNIAPYKNGDAYFDTSTAEGSMDYLNSIAPQAPQKTGLSGLVNKAPNKLFPIIGGAMIALVILVAIVAALGGAQKNGPTEKITAMNSSIQTLQTIIDYGKNNNFSSDMTDALAETNLVLASDRKALDNAGLGASSGDSSGDSSNSDSNSAGGMSADDFKSQMDKAKSNGNLESSYEQALKNGYNDVANKAKDVYDNIDDDGAKTALSNFYKNITTLSAHANSAMTSDETSSGLVKYYTYIPE